MGVQRSVIAKGNGKEGQEEKASQLLKGKISHMRLQIKSNGKNVAVNNLFIYSNVDEHLGSIQFWQL